MQSIIKRLVLVGIASAALYFVYWQGFYRGADTALCATSLSMDSQQGIETPFEPCDRVKNNWFFWKNS
jgi:hypothetical protein